MSCSRCEDNGWVYEIHHDRRLTESAPARAAAPVCPPVVQQVKLGGPRRNAAAAEGLSDRL